MPIISAFVMGLRRRARLRATFVEIAFLGGAAIATAVIGVVAPASTAVAAIPLPGISYSGPSAHGDYTVGSAQNNYPIAVNININVYLQHSFLKVRIDHYCPSPDLATRGSVISSAGFSLCVCSTAGCSTMTE